MEKDYSNLCDDMTQLCMSEIPGTFIHRRSHFSIHSIFHLNDGLIAMTVQSPQKGCNDSAIFENLAKQDTFTT